MEKLSQHTQNLEIYTEEYDRVKNRLLNIFRNKNEQEMIRLYSEIRKFAKVGGLDSNVVVDEIKRAFDQNNSEFFVNTSFNVLKILIDKKIENPGIFEHAQQGNIKLSELMYYNIDLENGTAFLHVADKGNLQIARIIKSFREGMKKLAEYIKQDERIREIQATSWIVASNPGLLEKAGFEVKGLIDEKVRVEHFSGEERPVAWARMSRETLLEKYLDA